MTASAPAPAPRLHFIDGLRALAVILVFLNHAPVVLGGVGTGPNWLLALSHGLDFGRMGVVAFFAISGFVIPFSFRPRAAHPVADFALARGFRLFPAFWLSIIVSVAIMFWLRAIPISPAAIGLNATMVPRLFHAPMVNGAYWTLEVELAFYAIAALLFHAQILDNLVVLSSLCFIPFALFLSSQFTWFGGRLNPALSGDAFYFWLHVAIIFWGASLRRIWQGERVQWLPGVLLGLFSTYWLIYLPLHGVHVLARHQPVGNLIRAIGGYSVGMGLFALTLWTRPRWGGLMNRLGRISYSFYLLHGPVLYLVAWIVARTGWHVRIELLCLASFALSLAAAALSFQMIERPCIHLGRALIPPAGGSP